MSDGVTIVAWLNIIDSVLLAVEENAAHLCVRFLNDRHLALALQNLHRKWARHHSRHAVGQACHNTIGNRLSLCIRFA